jgi:hypothetical protein
MSRKTNNEINVIDHMRAISLLMSDCKRVKWRFSASMCAAAPVSDPSTQHSAPSATSSP